MKFKRIIAACAVLCSGAAFAAATPILCATEPTTLNKLVNECAPEVTFYVAGASAQSGALTTILAAGTGIFNTAKVRGKIDLTTSGIAGLNGGTDRLKTNTVGYIGIGDANNADLAGKRVLVIYNKANGSFAGVNQMLTGKGGALEEVTLVTATKKNLAKGTAGTCAIDTESSSGSLGVVNCATSVAFSTAWGADATAQKLAQMSLSDVRPSEATPGIIKKWSATAHPNTVTGVQGFGVIVNPNLYQALIVKENAAGRLASSCLSSEVTNTATYTISAACQPNLDRALYTSLITGKVTTATALMGTTDTTTISLARRVDSSGTQAASNIFFAGLAGYNVKTPAADGFDLPLGAGVSGDLTVTAGSATGDVITAVSGNTTSYALGVVSLENTYLPAKADSKIKGALFVKIEGISPNFKTDGTLDAKARVGVQNGYPFAFDMQALKPTGLAGAYLAIYNTIVTALTNPANNLAGIAYIGSTDATKNTSFHRNGNNFLPLVKN